LPSYSGGSAARRLGPSGATPTHDHVDSQPTAMPRHPRSTCASPARYSLAVLLLVATPVAGRGQALTSVAPDTRVRVELLATERSWHGREQVQSVVGTLVETRADTLLLAVRAGAAPIRIPLASTRAVFVTHGRPPRWQSALRGAVVPAIVGAALSAATSSIRRRPGDRRPVQMALSSAAWGAASGAALGAWSPKERWRRLTVPTVTSPALAAGAAPRSATDTVRTP
jgi:hypothetical protein